MRAGVTGEESLFGIDVVITALVDLIHVAPGVVVFDEVAGRIARLIGHWVVIQEGLGGGIEPGRGDEITSEHGPGMPFHLKRSCCWT